MNKERNYRRIGAYSLMILSAFSMMIQYGLQGVLASGHATADLPSLFWQVDWVLWGLRALIEAVVILYLFETNAEQRRDRHLLYTFEVSLITLITATIAPAIRAQGLGLTMPESVSANVFTLWCVGLAMYTPLMMGGLATALRVQPGGKQTVNAEEHETIRAQLKKAARQVMDLRASAETDNADFENLQARVDELQGFYLAVTNPAAWKDATAATQLITGVIFPNGNRPKTKVLSKLLGVGQATVSTAIRKASVSGE